MGLFEKSTWNVIQLGFGFFLIFTSFNGSGFIEELTISSVANRTGEVDRKAGYYSLAMIYGVFTASSLVAPPIVEFVGPKWAMVIAACLYTLFMTSFLWIRTWLLYLCSFLIGFGAALLWTGQGTYLTLNSDKKTMGRNSGIFWAMLMCGVLVAGLFLYLQFRQETVISNQSIQIVYGSFTGLSALGTIVLAFLMKPPKPVPPEEQPEPSDHSTVHMDSSEPEETSPNTWCTNFVKIFKVALTLQMLLLMVAFLYTGVELTMWLGVYPTTLGFTKKFGSKAKSLVGLNAIIAGVGQIIGGASFGIFGSKTNIYGRSPIVILGSVIHLIAAALILVNIPFDAPLGHETDTNAYIYPSIPLALMCSFLLGLGDSCWNTQIISILGYLYAEDSAPPFALFKLVQSLAACASYYYGASLRLNWQLLIFAVLDLMGVVCFSFVDMKNRIKERSRTYPAAEIEKRQ